MYDKEHKVDLCGKLHIITVELKKLENESKEVSGMSTAEKWAYYFKFNKDASRSTDLQEIIKSEEAIEMAVKSQLTISADENRRAMLLTREKNILDYQSGMAGARRRGVEEGLRQGLEQGLRQASFDIARTMKRDNEPLEKIIKYTGLSEQEIKGL